MRFKRIQCSAEVREKLSAKHDVEFYEAEEALQGTPRIRREGDVYHLFGRTEAGRYLHVILRDVGDGTGRIVTAYDMTPAERRRHQER